MSMAMTASCAAICIGFNGLASAAMQPPAVDPAPSQAAAPPDPGAELTAWSMQVRKDIESITGETFTADVPVKVVTPDDLAQLLAASMQTEAKKDGARRADGTPMSDLEIQVHAMSVSLHVATRIFGMYRYEEKTIYVVPANAAAYAKKHGWSADTARRVPRLAVAHELVHALQDQRADLGKRLEAASGDERAALTSITEGHAVWVTDQVARKMDWGAANAVLWGVVTGVQTDDEPKPKSTKPAPPPPPSRTPTGELYSLGKAFIAYQAEFKGEGLHGNERLWWIVRHPPRSMSEVAAPEKFVVPATKP